MHATDEHEVVRLAEAANPFQAHTWQQALQQEGIHCQVLGDYLEPASAIFRAWEPRSGSRRLTLPGPRPSSITIEAVPKRQLSRRQSRRSRQPAARSVACVQQPS
jgi:hypothetical protein